MPSVATKQDPAKICTFDSLEGYRNLHLNVEKKIRNLEKKKKRLDEYQKLKQRGDKLDPQQEEALSSMGIVIGNLEFARDMLSQISATLAEQEKLVKKSEKKARIERERREVDSLRCLLAVQSLLEELCDDHTKEELFGGEAPTAGLALGKTELDALDELYQAITPRRELEGAAAAAAWIHVDMAGVMDTPEGRMTGRPVRALVHFLRRLALEAGGTTAAAAAPAQQTPARS